MVWGVYACALLITLNVRMATGNERSGLCGVPRLGISASQPAIGSRVRFPQGGVVATVISNSSVCAGHGLGPAGRGKCA